MAALYASSNADDAFTFSNSAVEDQSTDWVSTSSFAGQAALAAANKAFFLAEDLGADQFVFAPALLSAASVGAADHTTDFSGAGWDHVDLSVLHAAAGGAINEAITGMAVSGEITVEFAADLQAAIALLHADFSL